MTEIEALQAILLPRIVEAAKDGTLWDSAVPTVLLDAWRMSGDAVEMRKTVAVRLEQDEAFLSFVRMFVGRLQSHGFTDRVAKTRIQLDPQRLTDFVDVDVVASRVERLLKGELVEEDRVVLNALFAAGRPVPKERIPGGLTETTTSSVLVRSAPQGRTRFRKAEPGTRPQALARPARTECR